MDYAYPGFEAKPLTKDVLSALDGSKLMALMYAMGGAMGMPGHIEVIDEDYVRYVAETLEPGCDVSQPDVFAKFDGFRPICPDLQQFRMNHSNWIFFYLGMGNYLYLREDFYLRHGYAILNESGSRYSNWCSLVLR